jgi:hypothetical protein
MTKNHDRAKTAQESREPRAWTCPRLIRLNAGAAESGLSTTNPDGQFSQS